MSNVTLDSPRIIGSRSVLNSSSSKNLLILNALGNNPTDWTNRVLEQERRELEKLELILKIERQKAADRQTKLTEMQIKEGLKIEAVKERFRQKELELRERNKMRDLKAKARD